MNVPVPFRLRSADAWQRFAAAGGFDALTQGLPPLVGHFGGGGAGERLRQAQAARLQSCLPRPRRYQVDDERTQDIVRRLEAGETLEQAAKPWNITRERARQIAERWFSLQETSLGEIREAQRQAKRGEEYVEKIQEAPLCVVCQEPVLKATGKGPSRRRTCSPQCGEEFSRRPWRYDEKRRRQTRFFNARWTLEHPEGRTEAELAYARRVFENPDMPFNRRYRYLDADTVEKATQVVRKMLPARRDEIVAELERHGIEATDGLLGRLRRDLGISSRRRGFGAGAIHEWVTAEREERAC